jgi:hypothetical protein
MAELIVKVGKNNVVVTPTKTLQTTSKASVEIYDTENRQSYGADRVKQELDLATEQIAYWQVQENIDKFVNAQITKYTNMKTRAEAVQIEMDKDIEEPK